MDRQKRHAHYRDWTAQDFISRYPEELHRDAVGFLSIVDCAQSGFGFEGSDLQEYVRLSVTELIRAGAIVVTMDPDAKHGFSRVPSYNLSMGEVVEKIMAEWKGMTAAPDITWRWFIYPDLI